MNAKKCKRIRQELRQEARLVGGVDPRGLLYRDTRKQVGWVFPKGWVRENFFRLITQLNHGPWFKAAMQQAKPVYARQAVNVPGSFRQIYRVRKAANGP